MSVEPRARATFSVHKRASFAGDESHPAPTATMPPTRRRSQRGIGHVSQVCALGSVTALAHPSPMWSRAPSCDRHAVGQRPGCRRSHPSGSGNPTWPETDGTKLKKGALEVWPGGPVGVPLSSAPWLLPRLWLTSPTAVAPRLRRRNGRSPAEETPGHRAGASAVTSEIARTWAVQARIWMKLRAFPATSLAARGRVVGGAHARSPHTPGIGPRTPCPSRQDT